MLCGAWADIARNFKARLFDVLLLRNVQVLSIRGVTRTLSINPYSVITMNPDISQTHSIMAFAREKRADEAVATAAAAALVERVIEEEEE